MSDNPTETDAAFRAELYFRGDICRSFGVKEVVERANRLEANGTLGDSMVAGEWHRIQTDSWRSATMGIYEEFQEWAETNDLSLEPGFQRRDRSFVGMDVVEEVVVFPAVALALYEAEDLRAVFPCTDDERTYTVESALAAFERGDEDWLTQFDPVSTDRGGSRPRTGRIVPMN